MSRSTWTVGGFGSYHGGNKMEMFFFLVIRVALNIFLMLVGVCFALVLLCPVIYIVFRLYKKVLDKIDR